MASYSDQIKSHYGCVATQVSTLNACFCFRYSAAGSRISHAVRCDFCPVWRRHFGPDSNPSIVTDTDTLGGHCLGAELPCCNGMSHHHQQTNNGLGDSFGMEEATLSVVQGCLAHVGSISSLWFTVCLVGYSLLPLLVITGHLGLVDWVHVVSHADGSHRIALFRPQTGPAPAKRRATTTAPGTTNRGLSSIFYASERRRSG